MKKILLVGLLLTSTLAFSQVEKGDFSGTANVNFTSQKAEGAGDATISSVINVRGGYFFTDNIEGGASLLVFTAGAGDEKVTGVGVGPYAVYNFLTSDGKFLPYLGVNFLNVSTSVDGVDPINQFGGFGGFKYFLTEVVNIDTSLNYTSWLGDISGSSLSLNIGIGINFGKLK